MESIAKFGSARSDNSTNSHLVLAEAMRTVEALSLELDKTRAERDHLRALIVGSRERARLISGVA